MVGFWIYFEGRAIRISALIGFGVSEKKDKDDIKAFGLRNWNDRIAVNSCREGILSEQG